MSRSKPRPSDHDKITRNEKSGERLFAIEDMMYDKQLNLAVDLNGCPNRCLHCWLGHMPNRKMEPDADRFIMDCFSPYFDRIAFYSWLREPDYCDDYAGRWKRDLEISKNARPERFELASFFRIVRDGRYIPFLRSVGVKKVQLTLFGLKDTQDRYVGRKGAFDEVMKVTDLLINGGITPRWQCFINEENQDEIVELFRMSRKIREKRCPELEFFVHEGSCDGENLKLYPIRILKRHIPEELIPFYLNYDQILTEKECCESLDKNDSQPSFPVGDIITLNISNGYDVFYNFTHMTLPWMIGNLKRDQPADLVQRILSGDTRALRTAGKHTWAELAARYGDPDSERAFGMDDYRMYLVNRCLESPDEP